MTANCLGLSFLGQCTYDPANPGNIYFSLGEAIAALSVTLLIPQFLKPIYTFRLRARRLSIRFISVIVFAGVIAVLIGALIPNLPVPRSIFFGFPIFWEILGALLFGSAYAILVYVSLRPAIVTSETIIHFVKSAASFLAETREKDHVEFAHDLMSNLPILMQSAASVEFRKAPNAFVEFTNRKKFESGRYAATFLQIIADSKFCGTLVNSCPWVVAQILRDISEQRIYARASQYFVQELAKQAVLSSSSMMAREIGYRGFSAAPILSESLFGSNFINNRYEPFQAFQFADFAEINRDAVKRLNSAAEITITNTFKEGDYWGNTNIHALVDAYKSVLSEMRRRRNPSVPALDIKFDVGSEIKSIARSSREHLAKIPDEFRKDFYIKSKSERIDNHVFESIAELIFESLAYIANDFEDFDDPFWLFALGIMDEVFPWINEPPRGMDPLQQRVAFKILKVLNENIEHGTYPAISRVILAILGPYENRHKSADNAAYGILMSSAYQALKGFRLLSKNKPNKIQDFLPKNVQYVRATDELVHSYRGGKTVATRLQDLILPSVSLDTDAVAN